MATLRGYGTAGSVAAFSITQDSVITIWNVILGVIVSVWAFGFSQVLGSLRRKPHAAAPSPGS